MVRCGLPPAPWVSSTRRSISRGCAPDSPSQTTCSRSSRMSMAAMYSRAVDYRLEDIVMKGAWIGPATLELEPHALAPIAELPVRDVISATQIVADLTLGLGKVAAALPRQPGQVHVLNQIRSSGPRLFLLVMAAP